MTILGENDHARERLDRAMMIDPDNVNMPYNFACLLAAWVGDTEGAIDLLETVFPRTSRALLLTSLADPDLDSLRDHPRFKAIVAEASERTGVSSDLAQQAAGSRVKPPPAG